MPAPPVREADPDEPARAVAAAARTGHRWRVAAAAVLVAGLLAATGVWLDTDDDDAAVPGTAWRIVGGRVDTGADSAARDRQTERLGGKALVRTAAFDRWLGSLWHGRRLAVTIAALATVVAAACAWIAVLVDTPVDG